MRRLVLSLALLVSLLTPSLPALAAPAPHTYVFVIGGVGTTDESATADFATLALALGQVFPAGSWSMADLGYNGDWYGGVNAVPVPYSACDTTRDIWTTRDTMARTLAAFASVHPGGRIVLVGHSLGGFLAYYMADTPLAPAIAANVSIDAPLQGVTIHDEFANPPGCPVDPPALGELAGRGQMDTAARTADLLGAYNAGATSRNVGIVANDADCLYDLGLPTCPFIGADWRGTMYAPADWTATYHDPVEAPGGAVAWVSASHHAILRDYAAMQDVASFIAR